MQVTLTQDISFTITEYFNNYYFRFVFEDAFSVAPLVESRGAVSNTMGVDLNGVLLNDLSNASVFGAIPNKMRFISPNDFVLSYDSIYNLNAYTTFNVGDVVTLRAGTAVTNLSSSYLSSLSPSTTAAIVGNGGNLISSIESIDISTIPPTVGVSEPSTISLLSLVLIGFFTRRFSKK